MTQKTYVYGEDEVVKTGRTAVRKVGTQSATLVEVTPANKDNGTWKKWVQEGALFTIQESD